MTAPLRRSLTLILLAGLLLSGCNPSPTATPSATSTSSQPGSTGTTVPSALPDATSTQTALLGIDPAALKGVSLQVWEAFAGGAASLFASQAAVFNSSNEWGITVSVSGYGDYPSMFEAVNSALGSGGGTPDLVAALPEEILSWNTAGAVIDLTPYMNDPSFGLGQGGLADIYPVFLAQDAIHGRQVGLPAQRSAHFLFYNETWAHELGFSAPPQTADEFRQQACAANASFRTDSDPQNDGYGGWIVDPSWQSSYSWLLAFGGSVSDGTSYTFQTDPNLAALQFLKGLFDNHCAWLSTEATPFDSFARRSALFFSGDLADLSSAALAMTDQKNNDEWTVIPFPGPASNAAVSYGPSYTVLKSSPEKQLAAWLFARWLLSPENQAQWVQDTGLFPLRSSVLDQVLAYRAANPEWEAAVGYLSDARDVPQLASWRQVRYTLEDGVRVIFQMNTPLDQLKSLLGDMDSMAQELNK